MNSGTDAASISVDADGAVAAGTTVIGQITIVGVSAPSGLLAVGGRLHAPTEAGGSPVARTGATSSRAGRYACRTTSVDFGLQLPPIDPTALPADVRDEARHLNTAALRFERLLLEQLTSELGESPSLLSGGEDDGDGASASGTVREQPGMLADALPADSGLGLAPELYRSPKADGTVA